MARNAIAKVEEDSTGLLFNFADGESVMVEMAQISEAIKAKLVFHGLEQKLRDSYAGCETPAEAREYLNATLATLLAGEWSKRREASPREEPVSIEAFITAMASVGRTFDVDGAKAAVTKLREKGTWKQVASTKEYLAAAEAIRARRAAEKVAKATSIADVV